MGPAAHRLLRIVSLVLAAAAGACAPLDLPVSSHATVHNSTNRSYRLFVPASVRGSAVPAPLVVALHGAGGVPDIAALTRITDLAERERFIVVFPQAVGEIWNDSALAILAPNVATDVAFIRRVVDEVAAGAPVDRGRVFAVGLSNGGMMSLRLACEAADLFAGVAAVAATMPRVMAERCRPQRPVSVMLVNGTRDPLIPDRGGAIRYLLVVRSGDNLSTIATMAFWARLNDCARPDASQVLPDRNRDDGSRAVSVEFTKCRGARLRLIRVLNGGHTWPGGAQYLPRFMIGPVNRDFDATLAIWEFFRAAPRR